MGTKTDKYDRKNKSKESQEARMQKEKILSEGTMQNLRKGKGITTDTLNKICLLLRCQPSDVIEIIPTDEEKIKYF